MSRAAVPSLLRSINASAVLNRLMDQPNLSRAQLSRELNISMPTVTEIVNSFLDAGLVKEVGRSGSTGRPATEIAVNPKAGQIICLDVGGTFIKAGSFDFTNRLIQTHVVPTVHESQQAVIDQIVDVVNLLTDESIPHRTLAVGVPGFVLDGVVVDAPNLPDWRNLPLVDILARRLDLPVAVENDVNLAAVGETFYGVAKDCRNVVFLAIGTGIGAGIVIDGELYHGQHGAAGEIGYLVPNMSDLGVAAHPEGEFEFMTNMKALTRGWQQADAKATDVKAADAEAATARALDAKATDVKTLDAKAVIDCARERDPKAQQVVKQWARSLGQGLVAIGAILNPEVIVLGGGGGNAYDLICEETQQWLDLHLPAPPKLLHTQLGNEAALWGGVTLGSKMLVDKLTHNL